MEHSGSGSEAAGSAAAVPAPGAAAAATTSMALATVLAPPFLCKLDRLHLSVRRSLSTRPGNTPMPRGAQGSGIELESYKAYDPGDDLRHLDWNAYGRLDQLLIKTFRAEREAPLHLFVDTSASMTIPAADNKLVFSISLAASLAYISLRNNDPVRVVGISDHWPGGHFDSPLFRHRLTLPRLREFLLQLQPRGQTALAEGISAALRTYRSPGVALVLSDFLTEPSTYEQAFQELLARRFTVAAVRVIGPGERAPATLFRRGRLTDVENGRQRFITLSRDNLDRYQRALTGHLARLQEFCSRCEITLAVAETAAGLEHILFHDLPALGFLH